MVDEDVLTGVLGNETEALLLSNHLTLPLAISAPDGCDATENKQKRHDCSVVVPQVSVQYRSCSYSTGY